MSEKMEGDVGYVKRWLKKKKKVMLDLLLSAFGKKQMLKSRTGLHLQFWSFGHVSDLFATFHSKVNRILE